MLKYILSLYLFFFTPLVAPPAWLDLPDDDYRSITGCHDAFGKHLTVVVHEYKKLPVTCLRERVARLGGIVDLLIRGIDEEKMLHVRVKLQELKVIAENKKWYLEKLQEALSNGYFEEQYLRRTLQSVEHLDSKRKPLFLLNKRRYHTKYGEYWGEYWLEAMDPCHRQLMTYYDRWLYERSKSRTDLPFFLWLEEQNLSKDVPYLRYLSEEELRQATVCIKNGLLYFDAILIGADAPKEYLFIVDLNERLILAEGNTLIHHNSLSHSKPVLAVGKMVVFQGKLTVLSFESGHYIPSCEDGVRMIVLLQEIGVLLDDVCEVIFYNECGRQEATVKQFLSLFTSG